MGIMSFTGKIIEIVDQTPTVKSFRFERPQGFEFKAGQFCNIAYPDRCVAGRRSYSFSNSAADEKFFELTIKEHGDFTQKMFTLEPGVEFEVKGPLGNVFCFDENTADDIVFLAGGVGVTPFMSALQYADFKGMKNELVLLFSNKTEDEIIAKDRLNEYAERNENITVVHTLTRDENWQGEKGRINEEMIKKYVKKDVSHYKYFICGPGQLIESMKELLKSMSVPEEKIIIEDWGI